MFTMKTLSPQFLFEVRQPALTLPGLQNTLFPTHLNSQLSHDRAVRSSVSQWIRTVKQVANLLKENCLLGVSKCNQKFTVFE
jgi:hypothetical protein